MLSGILIVTGLWAIDIGASGMIIEAKYGVPMPVSNGFWGRDSMQQYHIGLWLIGLSSFMLIIIVIAVILEWKDENKG
jgi:hypothetical protein